MQTIAITGGAAGLGAVVAEQLRTRGHHIVLVDRDPQALSAAAGPGVRTVVADLCDLDDVRRVAGSLVEAGIDGLVNNAGSWSAGEQYPRAHEQAWLATMTLDLLAPMILVQRLWHQLEAVVNIGSSGGEGPKPYGSPEYGAAKAGLRRFTASLGSHDRPRVTAVVPGWIGLDRATEQWAELSAQEQEEAGPLLAPGDVASVAVDLLLGGRPGEVVELMGTHRTR